MRSSSYTNYEGGSPKWYQRAPVRIAIGVMLVLLVSLMCVSVLFNSWLGYIERIDATEIGVLSRQGAIPDEGAFLGPGFYFQPQDLGADVTRVNISGVTVNIPVAEVALAGGGNENIDQIVGLTISGIAFRPGLLDRTIPLPPITPGGEVIESLVPALNRDLWSQYKPLYLSDNNSAALIEQLTFNLSQAARECGGPRTLVQVVAGSNRTDLADCINREWNERVNPLGIYITSINITDVNAPPEIMESLSRISAANQAGQEAIARSTQVYAEGLEAAENVRSEIRVTAAYNQERLGQEATSVAIQQTTVYGERLLIEAQATNQALSLTFEQAQEVIRLEIASLQAEADAAPMQRLAEIYTQYPQYASVIVFEAYAASIEGVEKIFYLPENTSALTMIGNQLYDQNMAPITPTINLDNIVATPMALPTTPASP